MKRYDYIVIGTGSAMNLVGPLIENNPRIKIAIIDKDEPGGICLTRGCIPSKLLLYPAELIRTIEQAGGFGIDASITKIDFKAIMKRMRTLVNRDISSIRNGLNSSNHVDYYPKVAEFVGPYTLKVGNDTITGDNIFLCTGSKPLIPDIKGLSEVGYQTSDTILRMNELPQSIAIIGGGYIAAEYGHFFSSMGSKVTIVGRNPQFIPEEEPEVSFLAKRELQKHMTVITNHEVQEVQRADREKKVIAMNRANGQTLEVTADEILVASGRASNSDILHPEKGGIKTDEKGWIAVDDYLETSQKNIWAMGDSVGKHQFKHVANYESLVVYYNAVLKRRLKVDYHGVPHAVFTYPEIASVGLREKEAIDQHKGKILIGIQRYEDTAKGEAMDVKDCFAKVIVEEGTARILGAHIIGPYASVLIQEIINLMYTPQQSYTPIAIGMHIHPALSEVVGKAFGSLMTPQEYHHVLEDHYNLIAS